MAVKTTKSKKKPTKAAAARALQATNNTLTIRILTYCFTALSIVFLLTAYYYYGM